MNPARQIVVSGSFDDLRSSHIRFLDEASKLGDVHVLLWSDNGVRAVLGKEPRFPQAERQYLVEALRYVTDVRLIDGSLQPDVLPSFSDLKPNVWVVDPANDTQAKRDFCAAHGLTYHALTAGDLDGFPKPPPLPPSGRKKIIVTGCYDWFHSGHVRFCEECAQLGDLYVVVGSDANVRLLKGDGHPRFPQDERRYVVGSVRYVTQCLISTGAGWMDAEPEVHRIQPDMYVVNEDGDVPEKAEFCKKHGLLYVVLKRIPKDGLAKRSSTTLRRF